MTRYTAALVPDPAPQPDPAPVAGLTYHARIMSLQTYGVGVAPHLDNFNTGHKHARHDAAEIASEADAELAALRARLAAVTAALPEVEAMEDAALYVSKYGDLVGDTDDDSDPQLLAMQLETSAARIRALPSAGDGAGAQRCPECRTTAPDDPAAHKMDCSVGRKLAAGREAGT